MASRPLDSFLGTSQSVNPNLKTRVVAPATSKLMRGSCTDKNIRDDHKNISASLAKGLEPSHGHLAEACFPFLQPSKKGTTAGEFTCFSERTAPDSLHVLWCRPFECVPTPQLHRSSVADLTSFPQRPSCLGSIREYLHKWFNAALP